MNGVSYQLVYPLVFRSRNRNYGNSQHGLHLIYIYSASVASDFIHHVKSQDYGSVQLHQLHGQIQISFYVGGVNYIYDAVRLFSQYKFSRDDLLAAVGRKGIYSRKVGNFSLGITFYRPALLIYGDAGKISHMLVGSCQLIEESSLSTVLVSRQGKGDLFSSGKRSCVCLDMIPSFFSKPGVFTSPLRPLTFS